jgi:hypothetical protein
MSEQPKESGVGEKMPEQQPATRHELITEHDRLVKQYQIEPSPEAAEEIRQRIALLEEAINE